MPRSSAFAVGSDTFRNQREAKDRESCTDRTAGSQTPWGTDEPVDVLPRTLAHPGGSLSKWRRPSGMRSEGTRQRPRVS